VMSPPPSRPASTLRVPPGRAWAIPRMV
jgi:hypothetical protein